MNQRSGGGHEGDPDRAPGAPAGETTDRRGGRRSRDRDDRTSRSGISALCTTCVGNAVVDGGGVSVLSESGTLVAVHATDQVSATIEDLQFTLGEGPCVDAVTSRSPVLVADLGDAREGVSRRWPAFLAEASAAGVSAVFAFPLQIGAISIGTLDLYRRRPGPLTAAQLESTLRSADWIGQRLLDLDTPTFDDDDDGYPMTVHQAAGMVMVQLGSTIDEALVRLRATAYAEGVDVRSLAADVVAGRRRFGKEIG